MTIMMTMTSTIGNHTTIPMLIIYNGKRILRVNSVEFVDRSWTPTGWMQELEMRRQTSFRKERTGVSGRNPHALVPFKKTSRNNCGIIGLLVNIPITIRITVPSPPFPPSNKFIVLSSLGKALVISVCWITCEFDKLVEWFRYSINLKR